MNLPDITNDLTYVVSWDTTPDVVKIGKTTHLENRFRAFLNACHAPLKVLMICDAQIASEKSMHTQFQGDRITLEHFDLTDDLQAKIDIVNMSTGFTPYVIDRAPYNSPTQDDYRELQGAVETLVAKPLKLSPREFDSIFHQACGLTVADSAKMQEIPEATVKSHRAAAVSKCFVPNAFAAISKLWYWKMITPQLLHNIINE